MPESETFASRTPAHVAGDAVSIESTSRGDATLEGLMATHESALIAYAMSFLGELERARDVVQETFMRWCRKRPAVTRGGEKAWLFVVCRHAALDVLRKDRRVQPIDQVLWKKVAGKELAPDEALQQRERMAAVMQVMNRLSASQREVILLKFQQGFSYREIHQITGLNEGNIGSLIHTGLKRVRELLPTDC